MSRSLPAFAISAARQVGRLLIRLKVWVPLRQALDLLALVNEWRFAEDEAKRAKILSRINKKFAKSNLSVEVRGGIVYLNGSADSWRDVVEIGHLAGKGVPGVWGVVNKLAAPDGPKSQPPAPAAHTGKELAEADIVIIGGGVIGCALARELSKYDIRIVVVEKEADVACGQTKANNGMVHPALNPHYGTLMQKLNLRGNHLYTKVCEELGVTLVRCGMLAVVTHKEEAPLLELAYIKGMLNGEEDLRLLTPEELSVFEPNVTGANYGALYVGSAGVIRPYEITVAYAENAAANGVRFFFNAPVLGFLRENDTLSGVVTSQGTIRARLVINAAGVFADRVAAMAGAEEFTIHPRPGELIVFDRDTEGTVTHVVGELTLKKSGDSKGGGVMVSVDGNILFGPSAKEASDPEDKSTHREAQGAILNKFTKLVPDFPTQKLITSFTGIRAASYTEDFIIRYSEQVTNLLHVAGIQSPGLASAPAIAEYVEKMIGERWPNLAPKRDWQPRRERKPEFARLSPEEQHALIAAHPDYAHVVCRCEGITEHEVREACRGPIGATTVDGVKRRTRSGMGRCQGGFCGPYVTKIISQERGIPITEVTKDGPGSELFVGETKGAGDAN